MSTHLSHWLRVCVPAFIFVGVLAPAAAVQAAKPKPRAKEATVNQKVAAYSQKNVGVQVGDGQCAALATQALKEAGAKSHGDYTDNPGEGDYVWGDLVATIEVVNGRINVQGKAKDLQPGDIIQYRNAVLQGRTRGGMYTSRAEHHTSVLMAVSPDGRAVRVWEQNLNGEKKVTVREMLLTDLKSGWLRFYRPQAETESEKEK